MVRRNSRRQTLWCCLAQLNFTQINRTKNFTISNDTRNQDMRYGVDIKILYHNSVIWFFFSKVFQFPLLFLLACLLKTLRVRTLYQQEPLAKTLQQTAIHRPQLTRLDTRLNKSRFQELMTQWFLHNKGCCDRFKGKVSQPMSPKRNNVNKQQTYVQPLDLDCCGFFSGTYLMA